MSHLDNQKHTESPSSAGDQTEVDSVSGFSMSELAMQPLSEESWEEPEPDARDEPVDPELLARRRSFRSWVTRGMLGLAAFTMIGLLLHRAGQFGAPAAASPPASLVVTAAPANIVSAISVQAPAAETLPSPALAPQPNPRTRESLRDVELPPALDASSLARWASLARNATAEELADVDARLARLIKTQAAASRERSSLARAILWREHGRSADARRVFDDLARHARSRDVRAAARSNVAVQPSRS